MSKGCLCFDKLSTNDTDKLSTNDTMIRVNYFLGAAGVVIPCIMKGQFPGQSMTLVIIYVTYIIGDLIVIPFPMIFKKQSA